MPQLLRLAEAWIVGNPPSEFQRLKLAGSKFAEIYRKLRKLKADAAPLAMLFSVLVLFATLLHSLSSSTPYLPHTFVSSKYSELKRHQSQDVDSRPRSTPMHVGPVLLSLLILAQLEAFQTILHLRNSKSYNEMGILPIGGVGSGLGPSGIYKYFWGCTIQITVTTLCLSV